MYSFQKIVTVFFPLLKMYVAQHSKRQVIKMRKFNMFITSICVLFLVNLYQVFELCRSHWGAGEVTVLPYMGDLAICRRLG